MIAHGAPFADAQSGMGAGWRSGPRGRQYEDWNSGGISYFLPALMQVLLYLAATYNDFLIQE
ncbi:MAG TPA: hypothetical protein VFA09_19370 [Ktedonobacteraceae bacterium]|nr:hypothetical protein [Ktedonobacteraceae bacterium]